MLKNNRFVLYFCHLTKLARPETSGPYYVNQIYEICCVRNFYMKIILICY